MPKDYPKGEGLIIPHSKNCVGIVGDLENNRSGRSWIDLGRIHPYPQHDPMGTRVAAANAQAGNAPGVNGWIDLEFLIIEQRIHETDRIAVVIQDIRSCGTPPSRKPMLYVLRRAKPMAPSPNASSASDTGSGTWAKVASTCAQAEWLYPHTR